MSNKPAVEAESVPFEMYDVLKKKLIVQESEIKRFEEEIFSLNARIIEQESNMLSNQDRFEARLKEYKADN